MDLHGLDEIIHQPTRLRILATLYEHRRVRYALLRDHLGVTSGNLTTHVRRLITAGYVAERRSLSSGRFELVYVLTPAGSAAFRRYLDALRALLESMPARAGGDEGAP